RANGDYFELLHWTAGSLRCVSGPFGDVVRRRVSRGCLVAVTPLGRMGCSWTRCLEFGRACLQAPHCLTSFACDVNPTRQGWTALLTSHASAFQLRSSTTTLG